MAKTLRSDLAAVTLVGRCCWNVNKKILRSFISFVYLLVWLLFRSVLF